MEMLKGASNKAAPSLRLPDYTVRTALQPLLWTLADEASLALVSAQNFTEFILEDSDLCGSLLSSDQHR